MKSRRKFVSLIATILSVFMVATLFSACSNEAPSNESEVKDKEQSEEYVEKYAEEQAQEDEELTDDYKKAFDDVIDDSDDDTSDIKTRDSDKENNNIVEFEAEQ